MNTYSSIPRADWWVLNGWPRKIISHTKINKLYLRYSGIRPNKLFAMTYFHPRMHGRQLETNAEQALQLARKVQKSL